MFSSKTKIKVWGEVMLCEVIGRLSSIERKNGAVTEQVDVGVKVKSELGSQGEKNEIECL